MIECTRRFQFCAGHRVMNQGSKCAHLHGHNYVAFVTCGVEKLNDIGMVIDFSVIKNEIGKWIDENWDHGFIIHTQDIHCLTALDYFNTANIENVHQKLYRMSDNPTAENMAVVLFVEANRLMQKHGVSIQEVTIHETENCFATVKRADLTAKWGL